MREIRTAKGTWKVQGTNILESDSDYDKIKSAIEDGNLSEQYLQNVTGHRAPITIDEQSKTIIFHRF